MKDKSGKDIKPGDLIVYGKSFGRSAGLQFGKVLFLYDAKDEWGRAPGSKVKKVRFIGVDDGWSEEPPRLQKPSALNYSSHIVVLERDQISKKALKLLDTVNPEAEEYKLKEKK